jgi:CBS domain-containing protein
MFASKNRFQDVPPDLVLDFLRKTLPFNELPEETLRKFARHCLIDFYIKGTLIQQQGMSEVPFFSLIQKGGVKTYLTDGEGSTTLNDFRGEGEYFGALAIIQDSKANLNVETVEDTFCFLFPKEGFLELLESEPRVSRYFLRDMTEKLIQTAYTELRQRGVTPRSEGSLYLFSATVREIIKGEPQTIAATDSVQRAAQRMAERHIGSLLVRDGSGEIVGIITDKDLRTKVVARGLDYRTEVAQIMSAPIRSVAEQAVCFDALLAMMQDKIHHLMVTRQEKVVGVITAHDIMLLQGTSPLYLFREILAQGRIEGIYPLSRKVPMVVRGLIEEGAKAQHVTRMITILNDHVLDRLLTLQIEELGPPPLPFCWLLLGSEGRREQTFQTDQDNAILYANPENEKQRREADAYFSLLGEKMIEHLVACGFPRCPGEVMASNPRWRQPAVVWRDYFDRWLRQPDPEEILQATIFFDFRAGFGERSLAEELRAHLVAETARNEIFLAHLARDLMKSRPPLSFFRNLLVEKDGEHRKKMDVKTRGLAPFVDFARLLALKYGLTETNTLERLRTLAGLNLLPRGLATEVSEAYEFIMQLRLVHQLHMLEQDLMPDNYINPADLSDLEKQTLKDAFRVISRLQNHARLEFHLE